MALAVSRTYYLSSVCHTRISGLRSYASAAAVATNKNRPPATAKKTTPTEHLTSVSNPKVPVKTASRTHVSSSGPAAKAATKNARSAMTKTTEQAASQTQVQSQAEQMEQLDKILKYSTYMPTMDVWGQKVETLDVMIPYNIITARHRLNGLGGMWSQFWKNRGNDMKNMISLVALASQNAIPGVNTARDRFFTKLWKWPLYYFGTKSVRPTSWLATTRNTALDTYRSLNTALATNDLKEVKRLATDDYLTDLLASQKKRVPNFSYVWRFHREVNPTQIVSLRVIEGYLSPEDPKFGNRLMVHALVRFDTEQSLEIYDRQGKPVHEPATDVANSTSGSVPAEKRRVVQYLVMEKRMWYDGPWSIREQIWETTAKKS